MDFLFDFFIMKKELLISFIRFGICIDCLGVVPFFLAGVRRVKKSNSEPILIISLWEDCPLPPPPPPILPPLPRDGKLRSGIFGISNRGTPVPGIVGFGNSVMNGFVVVVTVGVVRGLGVGLSRG